MSVGLRTPIFLWQARVCNLPPISPIKFNPTPSPLPLLSPFWFCAPVLALALHVVPSCSVVMLFPSHPSSLLKCHSTRETWCHLLAPLPSISSPLASSLVLARHVRNVCFYGLPLAMNLRQQKSKFDCFHLCLYNICIPMCLYGKCFYKLCVQ